MKKWILAVLFSVVLVLSACGGDGGSDESENNGGETVDTAAAEAIYKESCASCHGDDLSGDAGPALTNVGSNMSKAEIEAQIKEGGAGMPADLVSGDELTTLAAWLAEKK